MRGGRVRALAILLGAIAIALTVAGLVLFLAGAATGRTRLDPNQVASFLLGLTYPIVGALVASRRPRNPIGWIYLVIGLSQGANVVAGPYAEYGLITDPGSLPLAHLMSWLSVWAWAPGMVLFTTTSLLVFPDGHHLSPRWRLVTVAAIASMVLIIVPMAVVAWPLPGVELILVNASSGYAAVSDALPFQLAGLAIYALASVAALVAVVVRWRRSRGIEREQFKWLVFAASVAVPPMMVSLVLPDILWLAALSIGLSSLIPISIAIAILRYRLYDIDLIINRTLVYVPMTALIAGFYAATVGLAGRLLAEAGQSSDVAIVLTTLVVVMIFTPVKNAVQAAVDRRFKVVPRPPEQAHDAISDPTELVHKLGGLRDAGLLTSAEFEAKKGDILARL